MNLTTNTNAINPDVIWACVYRLDNEYSLSGAYKILQQEFGVKNAEDQIDFVKFLIANYLITPAISKKVAKERISKFLLDRVKQAA